MVSQDKMALTALRELMAPRDWMGNLVSQESRDLREPRERWESRETRGQLGRLAPLANPEHLDYPEPLDSKV